MDTDNTPPNITCHKCGRKNMPNWKDGLCITCARDEVLGTTTQPTNSIGSELKNIFDGYQRYIIERCGQYSSIKTKKLSKKGAIQSINNLYISRQKVEEAIGTMENVIVPEPMRGIDQLWLEGRQQGFVVGRNELRAELRAKLLTSTKGEDDE